ncbi:MAG: YifB family Mg chelatase-like AAA ATPase [Oscillospiraceae bacterium]|nr:YifB family Mg chelatase-like AAA ATPase [Oscillospiraceae bacterium]
MFAITNSVGLFGMNAFPVTVEAEILRGHTQFDISGLPDAGIKESRERVRSAVSSCDIPFPTGRVLLNLAPADVRKSGTSFDLAVFVALMQAMGVLPPRLPESVFIGELGLNGTLHSVRGTLPMTMLARSQGFREIYVPAENVREAAAIDGIDVYGVEDVRALLSHLLGEYPLSKTPCSPIEPGRIVQDILDFSDVQGQDKARAGMELAAAGGHNILLVGSPGSGKSMLANRLPSILPEMTRAEILETTNVYSVAGLLSPEEPLVTHRPFRSPHHTVSAAGLIGGGSIPAPGEISLAHNGVLFLDELPEFDRATLEILRQPLESREVTISRAAGSASYPCSIMLVAAMNPCPCGYYGSTQKKCTCAPKQVERYLSRISGPLLDRFDMHVDVDPVAYKDLSSKEKAEPSAAIRQRVEAARSRQKERFAGTDIYCNAMIPDHLLREFCRLEPDAESFLKAVFERYSLSARAYSRLQKVALSSADLHGNPTITRQDIAMAVQFRGFDSKYLR